MVANPAGGGEGAAAVEFRRVFRNFGEVRALNGVSFSVGDGEFFSMLGPSGSGKTTCLRLTAGFDNPSSGEVLFYGESVGGVPPYRRNINTVFQDYALFPHMNVADNIGYGLMIRGEDKTSRRRQVSQMLEMVNLTGMEKRHPAMLSGGQRQRVALARALVMRPRVLLLDEPLGALDLNLREQMQSELKSLQRRLGVTFIYVTHDQQEALGLSDRIAVFNGGTIEQVDTSQKLYREPRTPFVAKFVGASNIIEKEFARQLTGVARAFSVRPENIRPLRGNNHDGWIKTPAVVRELLYHGATVRVELSAGGGETLIAVMPWGAAEIAIGGEVNVGFRPEDIVFFAS